MSKISEEQGRIKDSDAQASKTVMLPRTGILSTRDSDTLFFFFTRDSNEMVMLPTTNGDVPELTESLGFCELGVSPNKGIRCRRWWRQSTGGEAESHGFLVMGFFPQFLLAS